MVSSVGEYHIMSCFMWLSRVSQLVGFNVRKRLLSNSGHCATPLDFMSVPGSMTHPVILRAAVGIARDARSYRGHKSWHLALSVASRVRRFPLIAAIRDIDKSM